jgi:hypothetical protein
MTNRRLVELWKRRKSLRRKFEVARREAERLTKKVERLGLLMEWAQEVTEVYRGVPLYVMGLGREDVYPDGRRSGDVRRTVDQALKRTARFWQNCSDSKEWRVELLSRDFASSYDRKVGGSWGLRRASALKMCREWAAFGRKPKEVRS